MASAHLLKEGQWQLLHVILLGNSWIALHKIKDGNFNASRAAFWMVLFGDQMIAFLATSHLRSWPSLFHSSSGGEVWLAWTNSLKIQESLSWCRLVVVVDTWFVGAHVYSGHLQRVSKTVPALGALFLDLNCSPFIPIVDFAHETSTINPRRQSRVVRWQPTTPSIRRPPPHHIL